MLIDVNVKDRNYNKLVQDQQADPADYDYNSQHFGNGVFNIFTIQIIDPSNWGKGREFMSFQEQGKKFFTHKSYFLKKGLQ